MISVALNNGCKSGVIAGLLWGCLLLLWVSPLVHQAEVFETEASHSEVGAAVHAHENGQESFEPNVWQRPLLTVLGATLLGLAFALLAALGLGLSLQFEMVSLSTLMRRPWVVGLIIATAGFLIFQGLPSLGLRPALPGVEGSGEDHPVRQSWWLLSVTCSLAATFGFLILWPRARQAGRVFQAGLMALALGLILYPFFAVPEYSIQSVAPMVLQQKFIVALLFISGLFWLAMSTLLSFFLRRQLAAHGA